MNIDPEFDLDGSEHESQLSTENLLLCIHLRKHHLQWHKDGVIFLLPMFSGYRASHGCPDRMTAPHLAPWGGRMWQAAPCVSAAVASRGESSLITDCTAFLPIPLRETHTVN